MHRDQLKMVRELTKQERRHLMSDGAQRSIEQIPQVVAQQILNRVVDNLLFSGLRTDYEAMAKVQRIRAYAGFPRP